MKHFLFPILVLGCFSSTALAYRPISDDKLNQLIESFNYTPTVKSIVASQTSCLAQDIEYTTTYPQRETELNIRAKTYVPVEPAEAVPVVFIIPAIGGFNSLDNLMGETLCKNNIAAFVITTNLTGLDSTVLLPVTDHDHTHRRVASALKGGFIIAKTYPEINTAKIGLFGASLGGILGSVAYSVLPEISNAIFIVNGGDVPHILANSDQAPVVNLKKARMQEQGFTTDAEYENYLNENLEIDPLHFVKLINTDTVKFFLSTKDKSVPSVDQLAYYNALGQPKETKFYNLPHAESILSVMGLNSGRQNVLNWYNTRFAASNPRIGN